MPVEIEHPIEGQANVGATCVGSHDVRSCRVARADLVILDGLEDRRARHHERFEAHLEVEESRIETCTAPCIGAIRKRVASSRPDREAVGWHIVDTGCSPRWIRQREGSIVAGRRIRDAVGAFGIRKAERGGPFVEFPERVSEREVTILDDICPYGTQISNGSFGRRNARATAPGIASAPVTRQAVLTAFRQPANRQRASARPC